MTISILIPCYNEEVGIADCVRSCLAQTRPADQIVVVNDGSSDDSAAILKEFGDQVTVLTMPKPTGNKSFAQEIGLKFITSDYFVATDGDTVLDKDFLKYVEENVTLDPELSALSGYVRSMRHNWLTACRAFEYSIGQNLHKLSQHHLGFLFVIPGAAAVFKTEDFKSYIPFEHDTLTEDLDFTYRLHTLDLKIQYDRRMVVYTQDPATLHSYINQMRRWLAGGWQCLLKHYRLAGRLPKTSLILTMLYAEGLVFALMIFLLPLLSLEFFAYFVLTYLPLAFVLAAYAAWREKRLDLLLVPIPYLFVAVINSYIFLEQMVKEVFIRQKNLTWFKPERFASKPARKSVTA